MPPDRDHDRFGHARRLLDPLQTRALRLIGLATAGDPRRVDMLRAVGCKGRDRAAAGRTGLLPVEVDDPLVEGQPREHRIRCPHAHPVRQRLLTKRRHISLKPRIVLRQRWASPSQYGNEADYDPAHARCCCRCPAHWPALPQTRHDRNLASSHPAHARTPSFRRRSLCTVP